MIPTVPGWYWARQVPGQRSYAGERHGDSCGWRAVKVVKYTSSSPLEVVDCGDSERLRNERSIHGWEWGPRLLPPDEDPGSVVQAETIGKISDWLKDPQGLPPEAEESPRAMVRAMVRAIRRAIICGDWMGKRS